MKFVVQRERWLRGEGHDVSRLLRESDDKMCCVGFFAIQCLGFEPEEIEDVPTLGDGVTGCGDIERQIEVSGIYETNDDKTIDDALREKTLIEMFKQLDIEVVFEN